MKVDIIVIKQAIQSGKLKVFVANNKIFLEDTMSGECVVIGTVEKDVEKDGEK